MKDPHIFKQFKKNKPGAIALSVFSVFLFVALYAPLLASSKPILLYWNGRFYSPLFRYLFYMGFFTKPIDIFFNLLMFILPVAALVLLFLKKSYRKPSLIILLVLQFSLFLFFVSGKIKNPESDSELKEARQKTLIAKQQIHEDPLLSDLPFRGNWKFELGFMPIYEQINLLLKNRHRSAQHKKLSPQFRAYEERYHAPMPTLFAVHKKNEDRKIFELKTFLADKKDEYKEAIERYSNLLFAYQPYSHSFVMAKYELEHANTQEKDSAAQKYNSILAQSIGIRSAITRARNLIENYQAALTELEFFEQKNDWIEKEDREIKILIPALIRDFHWEEDAGGSQRLNRLVPWHERTRVNRKDMVASLIFGIRISIIVGVTAVLLSLIIGICLGTLAGYFAKKTDLVVCRVIEIWEAMPTFFMLLMIIAITQNKSMMLVICVLGLFGWTTIARFTRAEVLKQRNLPYVLASTGLGFKHTRIMFSHILPNAIAPVLTLLPFSMMAAITAEAGLSFLGLGEEGSTSWGVLMDEGRSVFPAESYLLWPPAILLTLLLISIALMGDALRDALDPKMRQ